MSSNSSITSSLNISYELFSQYLSFTFGFILLIFGTIGNILNIIIFLIYGTYKQNACCLYMFVGSLFDLFILLIGLCTRILILSFNIDLTIYNLIWCKLRTSLLDLMSLCSLTCLCLQSIDIFFCTSRSAIMRQKSNIKISRLLLIGFILFWIIYEIPNLMYQNIVNVDGVNICKYTNTIYISYHTYFSVLVFNVFTPTIIISFFAIKIYKNLHSIFEENRNSLSVIGRQMARMSLFQIIVVMLFQFPYAIGTAYGISTMNFVKTPYRQFQDKLVSAFFNIYVYGLYSSSFYCYYVASKRFRRQFFDVISRLKCRRNINQILPLSYDIGINPVQIRTSHL